MNQPFETFKRELSDRLSSPLLTSFSIAWVVWNYKFVYIILAKNSVTVTFSLLAQHCFGNAFDVAINGIALPLTTALLYIYVYPIPSELIYKKHERNKKRLKQIKDTIEGETPLTLKESQALRLEIFMAAEQHEKEISEKLNEINSLKVALKELSAQSSTQKPEPYAKYKFLPSIQAKILKAVSEREAGQISRESLRREIDSSMVEFDFAIGELLEESLITPVRDEESTIWGYAITHKGRGNLLYYQEKYKQSSSSANLEAA